MLDMKNNLLLIITIFLFGISVFFRKLAVDRLHPYQLQMLASGIYVIQMPIMAYLINKNELTTYSTPGIWYGVICLVTYIFSAMLFSFLLKSTDQPGMMSTLISMNPVITSLLSFIFLGETFSFKKIIATIIMLVGFYLFNM